jgi:hypothetical protein
VRYKLVYTDSLQKQDSVMSQVQVRYKLVYVDSLQKQDSVMSQVQVSYRQSIE